MKKNIGRISNSLSVFITILVFSLSSLNNYNVLIQMLIGGAMAFILSFSIEFILRFIFENEEAKDSS